MKKITEEEFNRRIKVRFPEEDFEIIEYYSGGKPAKIKCCNCGKEISISVANNFLAKNKAYGCVNCHGLWKQREEKIKKIKKYYDILYTWIEDTHTHYCVKCKKCGHVRYGTLSNLIRGIKCGCETGFFKQRTSEEFINEVNKATMDSYSLVGEYKGQSNKVLLRHNKCGLIRTVWAHDAIDGKFLCPKCDKKESRDSRYITNYLIKSKVFFLKEWVLDNGSRQRFDFFFPQAKIALEYDGIQHHEETTFFTSSLEEVQKRDRKKDNYCIEKGIEMIRIPYYYSKKEINKVLENIVDRLNDYPLTGVDSSESK